MRISLLFTLAFALAACLPSCCPTPPMHEPTNSSAISEPIAHVVLVHGFLQRGRNFKMLQKRLEARQVACHLVRLTPSDGRHGICNQAESLKQQIESRLGSDERFSLIGFSMGGLVSRYYLQNLDGAKRCDQLITVASPHNGTWLAHMYPGKGARQMERGSEFLHQLAATDDQLGDMPVCSYRTPFDLIVVPSNSSIWERAENRKHYALLHPLMLNIPSVLNDIEQRLLGQLQ